MTAALLSSTALAALGAILCLAAIWIMALNWSCFWRTFVRRQPAPSWIPLLGGALGAVGLALLPFGWANTAWWVPLVVDWGSLPGITHAAVFHAVRILRK